MIIQENMHISEIVKVWPETIKIFEDYHIPVDSNRKLEDLVDRVKVRDVLSDLNQLLGSSQATCIEGG
ncbi:hypothetical protein ACE1TI_16295 [Alteribacillus sp. JSM 102045]|uniref:hypothetical protein n=1 Tax=Alteribacillus sp. JSM 102045 TaxID=1562101 RepID=UPI0035C1FBF8